MSSLSMGRSHGGCWTCRVRRKKCDEQRPSCLACLSFELTCDGYGPKPSWMESETLQRQKAAEIKVIVGQARVKKKRRRSVPAPNSASPKETNTLANSPRVPDHTATDDLETIVTSINQGAFAQWENELGNTESEIDWLALARDETIWSAPLFDFPTVTSFDQAGLSRTRSSTTSAWDIDIHGTESSSRTASGTTSSVESLSQQSKAQTSVMLNRPLAQNIQENKHFGYTTAASGGSGSFSRHSRPYHLGEFVPDGKGNTASLVAGSGLFERGASKLNDRAVNENHGHTNDTLLMHYIDVVFYINYPFYSLFDKQGRGWLFFILKHSKSAYHATLALSELHLQSTKQEDYSTATKLRVRARNGHYDLAVHEMQHDLAELQRSIRNSREQVVQCLQLLTCILQLIFWEVLPGGTGNWQALLRTTSNLISTVTRLPIARQPASPDLSSGDTNGQIALDAEEERAIRILVGAFVSLDTMYCASTRLPPFLDVEHRTILESLGTQAECLICCENTVMALIFEISQLDRWKIDSEKANKLSIIELAKRGNSIEQRLRQKQSEIASGLAPPQSFLSSNPVASQHASAFAETNSIFVLAAIIYLHVVVSGPHPTLTEISNSVSRIIVSLQGLSISSLLANLVWPFCLAGCMAIESQQASFKALIETTDMTPRTAGMCLDAYMIMEECWAMRKKSSSACDWVSAMKERGTLILLR